MPTGEERRHTSTRHFREANRISRTLLSYVTAISSAVRRDSRQAKRRSRIPRPAARDVLPPPTSPCNGQSWNLRISLFMKRPLVFGPRTLIRAAPVAMPPTMKLYSPPRGSSTTKSYSRSLRSLDSYRATAAVSEAGSSDRTVLASERVGHRTQEDGRKKGKRM